MTATAFDDRPAAQQAGILCNDPRFQRFAAVRTGAPVDAVNNTAAAEYIRTVCKVTTRRDLDTNPTARDYFDRLRTDFDAWAGRILSQR